MYTHKSLFGLFFSRATQFSFYTDKKENAVALALTQTGRNVVTTILRATRSDLQKFRSQMAAWDLHQKGILYEANAAVERVNRRQDVELPSSPRWSSQMTGNNSPRVG